MCNKATPKSIPALHIFMYERIISNFLLLIKQYGIIPPNTAIKNITGMETPYIILRFLSSIILN